MWNAEQYFENIQKTLKLTKDTFRFGRVSGINNLEDVIADMKVKNWIAVDSSEDGAIVRPSNGFFDRRSIVVFVLMRYNIAKQEDRVARVADCKAIYRKMVAKLLKDSTTIDELTYLDRSRIPYHEVPGYFATGMTGIYFVVTINEPTALVYDSTDYDSAE